jgi:hypothetical protein
VSAQLQESVALEVQGSEVCCVQTFRGVCTLSASRCMIWEIGFQTSCACGVYVHVCVRERGWGEGGGGLTLRIRAEAS